MISVNLLTPLSSGGLYRTVSKIIFCWFLRWWVCANQCTLVETMTHLMLRCNLMKSRKLANLKRNTCSKLRKNIVRFPTLKHSTRPTFVFSFHFLLQLSVYHNVKHRIIYFEEKLLPEELVKIPQAALNNVAGTLVTLVWNTCQLAATRTWEKRIFSLFGALSTRYSPAT